ncbi:MAG: DUF4340 domain-containing protein [Treponema sp.]|nr:DUF4340 domain-containing protein [Treponema sp.]
MKARKIILLAGCALLLCICIIQALTSANDKVKIFEFSEDPDEIVLENANGSISIVKNGESWLLGDKKYPAADSSISDMINTFKSIKALDKVAFASSEESLARYDLNEGKKITALAKKDGKVLRSLAVGKDATSGSQSYITIDGGKDIYLATGNLSGAFSKSIDELRSREILNLDKTAISSVTIIPEGGTEWSLSRSGSGMDIAWNISGAQVDVDPEVAKIWLESLSTFVATKWHEENEDLGGQKLLSAKINSGSKLVTFNLYKIAASSEDGNDIFYGNCSECPYTFELASYAAQKFLKTPEELTK